MGLHDMTKEYIGNYRKSILAINCDIIELTKNFARIEAKLDRLLLDKNVSEEIKFYEDVSKKLTGQPTERPPMELLGEVEKRLKLAKEMK
jgi:hypothetical protein